MAGNTDHERVGAATTPATDSATRALWEHGLHDDIYEGEEDDDDGAANESDVVESAEADRDELEEEGDASSLKANSDDATPRKALKRLRNYVSKHKHAYRDELYCIIEEAYSIAEKVAVLGCEFGNVVDAPRTNRFNSRHPSMYRTPEIVAFCVRYVFTGPSIHEKKRASKFAAAGEYMSYIGVTPEDVFDVLKGQGVEALARACAERRKQRKSAEAEARALRVRMRASSLNGPGQDTAVDEGTGPEVLNEVSPLAEERATPEPEAASLPDSEMVEVGLRVSRPTYDRMLALASGESIHLSVQRAKTLGMWLAEEV